MKLLTLTLFCCFCVCCSSQEQNSEKHYLKNVGDIPFDKDLDDSNFKVCNEDKIIQYYATGEVYKIQGEKYRVIEYFTSKYNSYDSEEENGYITIRFIVNCNGQSGRFRKQEMDFNYQQKTFHPKISNQLLNLVSELKGWETISGRGKSYDYYQYLTFKIENGKLIEILP